MGLKNETLIRLSSESLRIIQACVISKEIFAVGLQGVWAPVLFKHILPPQSQAVLLKISIFNQISNTSSYNLWSNCFWMNILSQRYISVFAFQSIAYTFELISNENFSLGLQGVWAAFVATHTQSLRTQAHSVTSKPNKALIKMFKFKRVFQLNTYFYLVYVCQHSKSKLDVFAFQ